MAKRKQISELTTYFLTFDGMLSTKDKKIYDLYTELKDKGQLLMCLGYLLEKLSYNQLFINTDQRYTVLASKVDNIYSLLEKMTRLSENTTNSLEDTSENLNKTVMAVEELIKKFNSIGYNTKMQEDVDVDEFNSKSALDIIQSIESENNNYDSIEDIVINETASSDNNINTKTTKVEQANEGKINIEELSEFYVEPDTNDITRNVAKDFKDEISDSVIINPFLTDNDNIA